ncbi:MAG TPA: fatty acyl-AMP ligase [Chloroflexota bacterium]|jgi:acyl-CoA synthetase (AMP-forming)/AMP-acid ligase II
MASRPGAVTEEPADPICSTLIDLLRLRSERSPAREAFAFLLDGEVDEATVTYAALDRQARSIAAELGATSRPGERALLLYPSGLPYIAAFFGCLYAGVVAVPAYPPGPNPNSMPRLRAIVDDAGATVALTTAANLAKLGRWLGEAPELARLRWLATDAVDPGASTGWREPPVDAGSLALLQYTSGSTGAPKGVMLTHDNLLHNLAAIHCWVGDTPGSHLVSWLPPYHDLGLVGSILHPIYGAFPATLMAPTAFLQQPLRWLRAISNRRATISGAPNFAYEMCVRRIGPAERASLELSSWEVAANGAEPVRAETLARFSEAFAPAGFRPEAFCPGYGMAEATLMVTGDVKTHPPVVLRLDTGELERGLVKPTGDDDSKARSVVSCGRVWPRHEVLIVDPETGAPCPPDRVGEVWASGPSFSRGYWNRPDLSERVLRARLAGIQAGPFLRTGDLGFVRDGEVFVVGRMTDLIIIRGRNHHPNDLEATVAASHPALRTGGGAAFPVEHEAEEHLVVVHEVDRHHLRDLPGREIVAAIRRALWRHHELRAATVVLVMPSSVPMTSSGKVQRHACRARFLTGQLASVYRDPPAWP